MKKQVRDAKVTKAKIIKNAMELFAKNGYGSTSTEEIAKACSINKALIFYYFKNKNGLYTAVMSHALESIYEAVIKAPKCCNSPIAQLEVFIKTYASYCAKNSYLPALILKELSNSGAYLPNMMFDGLRKLFSLLSNILKDGEESGIFHNVIPMVVHFMIVGTLNLFITTKPLRKTAEKLDPNSNTCSECSIDEISDYVFTKIKLMLEVK